jgi:hypothetical protein
MILDPFRLSIAVVPLAAYLILLGMVSLRRRPLVVSGASDLATLGAALTGVVFIGPIELFRPEPHTVAMGNYIWLVLLAFYGLVVMVVVLLARPRIVVYNIRLEELHPVLAEVAARLDPDGRWAGNQLSLPRLGVQLHLDGFELMRNVALVASGASQNIDGWRRLGRALAADLQARPVSFNPRAAGFLLAAIGLVVLTIAQLLRHPIEMAQAFDEVFAF